MNWITFKNRPENQGLSEQQLRRKYEDMVLFEEMRRYKAAQQQQLAHGAVGGGGRAQEDEDDKDVELSIYPRGGNLGELGGFATIYGLLKDEDEFPEIGTEWFIDADGLITLPDGTYIVYFNDDWDVVRSVNIDIVDGVVDEFMILYEIWAIGEAAPTYVYTPDLIDDGVTLYSNSGYSSTIDDDDYCVYDGETMVTFSTVDGVVSNLTQVEWLLQPNIIYQEVSPTAIFPAVFDTNVTQLSTGTSVTVGVNAPGDGGAISDGTYTITKYLANSDNEFTSQAYILVADGEIASFLDIYKYTEKDATAIFSDSPEMEVGIDVFQESSLTTPVANGEYEIADRYTRYRLVTVEDGTVTEVQSFD